MATFNNYDRAEIERIVREMAQLGQIGSAIGGGGSLVSSVNSLTGDVVLTATSIGLGSVNNTTDASKPVSTAQATAIGNAQTAATAAAAAAAAANAATVSEVAGSSSTVFWGDSLTQGFGGVSFVTQFASLSGLYPYNMGIGGETSTQIKARFDANPQLYKYGQVFWVGRNDISISGPSGAATIKSNLAAMIAALPHTRFVVIGVTNTSSEPTGNANLTAINTLNGDLATLYGAKFIDIRAYLLTQGTGTGQDATDAGNSVIPTSLRFDGTHINTLGSSKAAGQLYAKFDVLTGPNATKSVTVGTVAAALNTGKPTLELADGGKIMIGDTQMAFLPNQDATGFTQTLIIGDGGAALSHTTGSEGWANLVVGMGAGTALTTGNSNTIIGPNAGKAATTLASCTFIGYGAGILVTSGNDNTFVGTNAGSKVVTGIANTAVGSNALSSTTGGSNTAVGNQAGGNIVGGSNNTFVGYRAGRGAASSTAGNGGALGYQAGSNLASGNGNFAIGYNVDFPSTTNSGQGVYQNALFITGATGTGTTIAGSVGIGLNAPTARLHLVAGTATANTAPLKLTSGTNLTTAENGAFEYDGTNLYFTVGSTRKTVTLV